MRTPKANLQAIYRGDPRTIFVTVTDPADDPIDLSNNTWTCVFRRYATATEGIALTVDPAQLAIGVVKLMLSGDQSRDLGRAVVGELQGSLLGTILSFSGAVVSDATRTEPEPVGGVVETFNLTWGGADPSTISEAVRAVLVGSGGGYTHTQASALDIWTVNHNLGYRPNVQVFSVGGVAMMAQIVHISSNQSVIYFNTPVAGSARLS